MRAMYFASEDLREAVEHYLYDLSLPVNERSAKRLVFKSGMAAANYIGVTPIKLHHSRNIGDKIYSPTQNKWFAVRHKKSGNERKPI